eukprot:CAMPEP_0176177914 /NCGR_PEP_ID=MMETSP0120_2-20121206/91154_1 /TAXON_ID=160619 /ORGANISM="Kryptoperidinium foliaceum, Strain CCMP 1326" /LENGTH=119 /DNA_ID=CAMNT_0017516041 /DNA_START=37 /DNA_END=396 /DNA_ORIENTATION=+
MPSRGSPSPNPGVQGGPPYLGLEAPAKPIPAISVVRDHAVSAPRPREAPIRPPEGRSLQVAIRLLKRLLGDFLENVECRTSIRTLERLGYATLHVRSCVTTIGLNNRRARHGVSEHLRV